MALMLVVPLFFCYLVLFTRLLVQKLCINFSGKPKIHHMDDSAREQLKAKIIATIEEMGMKIKQLEENTKPIGPENAIGRVSRMDAINNKSVAEAALRSSKRKLSKLQTALTKIDRPEFGICTRCKRPIATARLMYMPESNRCIRCADR